jgi:hypothetical protein
MARKKGSSEFEGWAEQPDEAAMEAEVGVAAQEDDGTQEGSPVRVKLADEQKPGEPELSPTTKAEMEAGRKALEEVSQAPKSKDEEPA